MTLQILSYQKLLFSLLISSTLVGDTTDIDLDNLWDTTVWEEIEEITEVEGEVEQVVSVAGVRGAEAEGTGGLRRATRAEQEQVAPRKV